MSDHRAAMTGELRAAAMAFPEVAEKEHGRFHVPLWQVRGRTFLGIGRREESVVFCISEESALAAADPEHAAAVRRSDARRSFLALEVRLSDLSGSQIRPLVLEAWTNEAPKALVEAHLAASR